MIRNYRETVSTRDSPWVAVPVTVADAKDLARVWTLVSSRQKHPSFFVKPDCEGPRAGPVLSQGQHHSSLCLCLSHWFSIQPPTFWQSFTTYGLPPKLHGRARSKSCILLRDLQLGRLLETTGLSSPEQRLGSLETESSLAAVPSC